MDKHKAVELWLKGEKKKAEIRKRNWRLRRRQWRIMENRMDQLKDCNIKYYTED